MRPRWRERWRARPAWEKVARGLVVLLGLAVIMVGPALRHLDPVLAVEASIRRADGEWWHPELPDPWGTPWRLHLEGCIGTVYSVGPDRTSNEAPGADWLGGDDVRVRGLASGRLLAWAPETLLGLQALLAWFVVAPGLRRERVRRAHELARCAAFCAPVLLASAWLCRDGPFQGFIDGVLPTPVALRVPSRLALALWLVAVFAARAAVLRAGRRPA